MYDYLLNEAKLKASERTDFGIPSKKAYPMPDADHVRAAIRMFNHCDPEDEAELARNIKKYMKKYGIEDVEVSEKNRFSKYYKKPVKESYIEEASIEDTYEGMKTNQSDKEWRLKIKNIPLDKEALLKLGYPLAYANKPQPCIFMNGKKYRARAELLLFNEDGDKVLIKRGTNRGGFPYTLCGGGIDDPKSPIAETAIRECEEEALIRPKNVEFTGIVWFMEYHKEVTSCDGAIVFVCTGTYDKPYKGYVKKIDRDSFAQKAKWEDWKKAKLGEPHKLAAEMYLGINESYIEESSKVEEIEEEDNSVYFEEDPDTPEAIAEEMDQMIQELSGGGGPVVGMEINDQSVTTYNPGMFIISYGSKRVGKYDDDDGRSSGYAVANDFYSKYIYVKKNGKAVREEGLPFLRDRKISIYEFVGDRDRWFNLLKAIDEGTCDGEFYTALTGRTLYTDDQIYFDEHFKYYNPIKRRLDNDMTFNINEEFSLVEGKEWLLPVMDDEMMSLQEKVNNINPYLTIKEGPKGYYLFDEAHSMCSAHPVSKRDIEMYLKK